jgi:hypothetical protein
MRQAIQFDAMRIFALLCVGAAVIAGGATAARKDTGLYGRVMIYPAYPVCMQGVPCTRPAGDVLLRFSRNGHVVATTRTHADGTFRLALAPGLYSVGTQSLKERPRLAPKTASVPRTRFAQVNFTIDVGIR